jgi:DNA-binding NarL/FixJ family response regulator
MIKILIVDDHVLFREGLAILLKQEDDFQVVGEASTVEEAEAKALELKPDLILLDMSLPDGTGLDAMKRILVEQPDIDIVMLTIHDTNELVIKAIRAGAKGFILKNIQTSKLVATLRGVRRGEPALSRGMTSLVVQELYKQGNVVKTMPEGYIDLTKRELQVMELLADGSSNREIAEKLIISENTVKNHIRNILDKLKLKNRYQVANLVSQFGLRTSSQPNLEKKNGYSPKIL